MGFVALGVFGSLHICVTLQHLDVVPQFLEDLESCVKEVGSRPTLTLPVGSQGVAYKWEQGGKERRMGGEREGKGGKECFRALVL